MYNQLEKFREIHSVIFDVDGVLTNNQVLSLENGDLLRSFNVKDGLAIKFAVQEGIQLFAITGGRSEGVRIRLEGLGFQEIHSGTSDKLAVYKDLIERHQLDEGGILYIGDDLPDYPVMRRVGLPACPKDACPEVRGVAKYVSPFRGGEGCARDILEKLLRIQEKWPKVIPQE